MTTYSRRAVLCHYRYDPLDRLVDRAPSAEAIIRRFYCKNRMATEIQGAVESSIFQHEDQLLALLRRVDVNGWTALLATDQQRSVLTGLDATGARPYRSYTPYGHRPAENGLFSLLGFNGEQPDPVTGHYLLGNGSRTFNPVLMRFNSSDSLSPFGKGELNAYGYCIGDPINRNDPTGHTPIRSMLKSVRKPLTPQSTTLTSIGARSERAAKSTPTLQTAKNVSNLKQNKAIVEIAKANEAKLGQHDHFTINPPLTDPIEIWSQYEFLKLLHEFETFPNIYKKIAFSLPSGAELLNTIAFDTRIDLAKSLSKQANLEKLNNFLSKEGLPEVNILPAIRITGAEIARYKYIQHFTKLDFTKEIRQS
ncbi:RHS repeat-associated core domain-containing protein [Pseudomonas sp. R151218B TE3479]